MTASLQIAFLAGQSMPRVDVRLDCGHLGSLRSPEMLSLYQSILDEADRRQAG